MTFFSSACRTARGESNRFINKKFICIFRYFNWGIIITACVPLPKTKINHPERNILIRKTCPKRLFFALSKQEKQNQGIQEESLRSCWPNIDLVNGEEPKQAIHFPIRITHKATSQKSASRASARATINLACFGPRNFVKRFS